MTETTQPMFSMSSINSLIKSISTDYEKRILSKLKARGFDGFHMSYYFILNELSVNNKTIRSDMAFKRNVTPQTIGKQISSMEGNGYILVERSKDDIRAKNLYITKKGHDLISAILEINSEIESEYKAPLFDSGSSGNSIINDIKVKLEYMAGENDIKLIVF